MPPPHDRNGDAQGVQQRLDPRSGRDEHRIDGDLPGSGRDAGDPAAGQLERQRLGSGEQLDPGRDRATDEAVDDAMLIGPAVGRAEPGTSEAATGERRPALSDLVRVQKLAVDAEAVLKPHMRSERGGLLRGSRQEQVADRAEERIDTVALRELVPGLGAQLRQPDIELGSELLADASAVER